MESNNSMWIQIPLSTKNYFKTFLIENLARSHGLSLNGTGDLQVDLLDIPGKGRCCVFIARFSYDPPE